MILWAAECCCEDIDENDQDHHDANADVYTEEEQILFLSERLYRLTFSAWCNSSAPTSSPRGGGSRRSPGGPITS